ncbi:hypothetical protein H634G_11696, partial [Metarhizium anisopliae BRIP 53293]
LAVGVVEREESDPSFLWSTARLQIWRTGVSHEIHLFNVRNEIGMRDTHAFGNSVVPEL